MNLSEALGCVLAEDAAADRDSPPYEKALMDGYAVIAADLAEGAAELAVLEEVTAGQVPTHLVARGRATRIMTGAPLPPAADCVVMVEHSELVAEKRVRLASPGIFVGANVMRQGESFRQGEVLLPAGTRIGPAQIGILAEVGMSEVLAVPRPRVAVLATGNELVTADSAPGPGQIRNTNGPLQAALVRRAGGEPLELGIARDDPAELARLIAQGLECDMLVLSGGVSAGVLDLVPAALASQGVQQVFHKVDLKPGKPLWFGEKTSSGGTGKRSEAKSASESAQSRHKAGPSDSDATVRSTLVFGLPGNPVSGLVCFELFVRPALAALAGRDEWDRTRAAKLAAPHTLKGNRPTYWPGRLTAPAAGSPPVLPQVEPLPWRGSADLATLTRADCLIAFPAGQSEYASDEQVQVLEI